MSASIKRVVVDDPFLDWESDLMRFRLTYEGTLLSETSSGQKFAGRAKHKQEIRKAFHKQLKRLWKTHPAISDEKGEVRGAGFVRYDENPPPVTIDEIAAAMPRLGGYQFAPLVTRAIGVHCGLDILFLRQNPPGNIVNNSDIDNRIKTLVDGLKMPRELSELGGYVDPDEGENPFFCLLQDDSLITRLTVEADTLLEPIKEEPVATDARVVITVTLKPYVTSVHNLHYG